MSILKMVAWEHNSLSSLASPLDSMISIVLGFDRNKIETHP